MLWISEKVLIKMQGTATKTIAGASHQKFYSFCSRNLHWTLCKTTKFRNSWFTFLLLDSCFNTQLCHKCLGPLLLWAASLTNLNGLCVLGKTSIQKKTFSFGHCPNHLTPPWPQFGQLGPFFRTSKFKIWKQYCKTVGRGERYINNLKNS